MKKTKKITLKMNRFGHVHIFKGRPKYIAGTSSNYTYPDGRESDAYWQEDIEPLKSFMSKKQWKDLNEGWQVTIDDFGIFE
jgi:hypothetical protein